MHPITIECVIDKTYPKVWNNDSLTMILREDKGSTSSFGNVTC